MHLGPDNLFITATGTDVGKTYVACTLLAASRGRARALKPVASGYDFAAPGASDPGRLLEAQGVEASEAAIAAICPWRFLAPLAPDAAARAEHRTLPFAEVRDWCVRELAEDTRPTLVEGAGGVMSPIAEDGLVLDLVTALGLPSLLVTGVYLGAITHTLTALAALRGRGCGVRAVVVNRLGASEAAAAALCEALRSHDRDASPVLTLPEALADWTNGLAGD